MNWNTYIADVVTAIGSPELPEVLTSSISAIAEFEYSVIFGYPANHRPAFLYDGIGANHGKSSVPRYLREDHQNDPFYKACLSNIKSDLYRLSELSTTELSSSYEVASAELFSPCISGEPGFLSEEIGFIVRNSHGAYIILSLMRANSAPPFSATEFDALNQIKPVVLAVLARHWEDLGSSNAGQGNAICVSDYVEKAVVNFETSVLTEREQEISGLMLRGYSSTWIAKHLGITRETVKTHRRNLYAKLHISSQSELMAHFIDTLSTTSSKWSFPVN